MVYSEAFCIYGNIWKIFLFYSENKNSTKYSQQIFFNKILVNDLLIILTDPTKIVLANWDFSVDPNNSFIYI